MTHPKIRPIRNLCSLIVLSWMTSGLPAKSLGQITRSRPNVVLLFIDDLGFGDTSPYGSTDIPTPNLDRLANEGVVSTASYITNPPCCPSRCSLMMGMYAQRFGKYGMSRGLPIPEDKPTLAEFMRGLGYTTGQVGKWDLGSRSQGPLTQGFMEVAKKPPQKQYSQNRESNKNRKQKKAASKYICITEDGKEAWLTDVNGDQMVSFIERNKEKPFFLYFSPEAVHSSNAETPARLTERTTAIGRRKKLAGAIVSVDDQVGKLLAVLEKHQLRENTLIIFSSDNGANGGEGGTSTPYRGGKGKGTQQEGWVRVPTIFSMPTVLPQGETYEGMTCTLDYYTTIAATINAVAPKHLDGVNLLPFLTGQKTGDAHEFLFWMNNDPTDAPRRRLIAVRWKDWRLYHHKQLGWQLFDLKSDPREEQDVAAEFPSVVATMKRQHSSWAETLPPVAPLPHRIRNLPPMIPTGFGWAFAHDVQSDTENRVPPAH
ncbi:MAG: sulfatase-like hydrolase/transferase [Planctomycetaceae bacterium]|nr:sulfatase-like hydrolase/transferase [Planctomycetaceae bacterium]